MAGQSTPFTASPCNSNLLQTRDVLLRLFEVLFEASLQIWVRGSS